MNKSTPKKMPLQIRECINTEVVPLNATMVLNKKRARP